MVTASTTVAHDLMVLLRYGDKRIVQQLFPTEDHGHRSHYRGAGPHGPTQVRDKGTVQQLGICTLRPKDHIINTHQQEYLLRH